MLEFQVGTGLWNRNRSIRFFVQRFAVRCTIRVMNRNRISSTTGTARIVPSLYILVPCSLAFPCLIHTYNIVVRLVPLSITTKTSQSRGKNSLHASQNTKE
jgi:hypothetical protein